MPKLNDTQMILLSAASQQVLSADSLATDISGEQRAEPVPPMPHRLVADIDVAFGQQILDVPQGQREAHVHHYYQAITSGDELKYRNGLGGLGQRGIPPA